MLQIVGRGVQAFSMVEFGLAVLFASIMAPADRGMSVETLDAAHHIETKLRIVGAVVSKKLTGSDLTAARNLNRGLPRNDDVCGDGRVGKGVSRLADQRASGELQTIAPCHDLELAAHGILD
jgi:hypothetical protein